jgi:hypothetical protein
MTPVMSGGLVYEYSEETNDYGLVNISTSGSAQLLPDYDTLQSQFDTLNITALQGTAAQNTSIIPPTCESSLILSSTFNSNFTIPDVPPGAQDIIDNGVQNANVGSLVSVTATKVTQTVENASGTVITGLAITPLADDQSNNPTSQSTTTTSSAPAATSKKSGAGSLRGSCIAILGMFMAICWVSLL